MIMSKRYNECRLRLIHYKRFVSNGTHPNPCFPETFFVSEISSQMTDKYQEVVMTEQEIISAIEGHVAGRYSSWIIGVTDQPDKRKQQHERDGKDVSYWHQWDASTELVARRIERYFVDKGCRGAGGGPGNANYVYIF